MAWINLYNMCSRTNNHHQDMDITARRNAYVGYQRAKRVENSEAISCEPTVRHAHIRRLRSLHSAKKKGLPLQCAQIYGGGSGIIISGRDPGNEPDPYYRVHARISSIRVLPRMTTLGDLHSVDFRTAKARYRLVLLSHGLRTRKAPCFPPPKWLLQ